MTDVEDGPPTVRKRPSTVKSILETFKKHKAERDQRSWAWARRELNANQHLDVGDKIYVRYQVQHIVAGEEIDSGVAEDEDDGIKIVDSQVFWWPGVVTQPTIGTCESVGDRWSRLKETEDIPIGVRVEFVKLALEKPELPIWEIQYEAHHNFQAERMPVIFLEGKRVFHPVIDQLHIGPYRTQVEMDEPNHNSDPDNIDDLVDCMNTSRVLVPNPITATLLTVPSEALASAGDQLRVLLRKFIASMAANSHSTVVTAKDVRKFFNSRHDVADEDELCEEMKYSGETVDLNCRTDCLTETPFPRPAEDGEDDDDPPWSRMEDIVFNQPFSGAGDDDDDDDDDLSALDEEDEHQHHE